MRSRGAVPVTKGFEEMLLDIGWDVLLLQLSRELDGSTYLRQEGAAGRTDRDVFLEPETLLGRELGVHVLGDELDDFGAGEHDYSPSSR